MENSIAHSYSILPRHTVRRTSDKTHKNQIIKPSKNQIEKPRKIVNNNGYVGIMSILKLVANHFPVALLVYVVPSGLSLLIFPLCVVFAAHACSSYRDCKSGS